MQRPCSAALVAVSAGAARTVSTQMPLLTYAVYPSAGVYRGLCATDLSGHIFRVSDPHDISGAKWSPDGGLIVYSRWDRVQGQDHLNDVVVTNPEGRRFFKVTLGGGRGTVAVPGWSPHGHKLLIVSAGLYEGLSFLDLDSFYQRTLGTGPCQRRLMVAGRPDSLLDVRVWRTGGLRHRCLRVRETEARRPRRRPGAGLVPLTAAGSPTSP